MQDAAPLFASDDNRHMKLYADENVESFLVAHLRNQGLDVEHATELGYKPRDDQFHLQEARRRNAVLITRDLDFLDNRKFPFFNLRDTAIIVFRTETNQLNLNVGYALVALLDWIAKGRITPIFGLKIEIKGPRFIFHAEIDGQIKRDELDISKKITTRRLFNNNS
jgi:predicted nuclease of predicted toxin-antitoxin system